MAAAGTARRKSAKRKATKQRAAPAEPRRQFTWFSLTLTVVGLFLAVRLAVNALEPFPAHFDEAQYWAYGQELDWGYFSKPPLVGAVIRLATDTFGNSLFAMRLYAPLSHALIAWMLFLTGSRLWDGRTGFWAATGYTVAPGVGYSAMIASTDPLMMAAWAVALYAMVRGLQAKGRTWWIVCGIAIGLGAMAKYTALAFPAAALAFMAFSPPEQRNWRGLGWACAAGLLVLMPNIVWNAMNGFATVAHVAEDADPGQGYFHPVNLLEFLGAQLAVIGPPFFLALFPALAMGGRWSEDWGMRLAAWQCWLLLGAIMVLAFVTRANGNWAAPAYIGGSLMAARFLLMQGWRGWLIAQVAIGATVLIVLYAASGLYAMRAEQLHAGGDPFRKTRLGPAFCEAAMTTYREAEAMVMLSNSRHRLSECMFEGNLAWDQVAVWNPDLVPSNHHELIATLRKGDDRPMVLALTADGSTIAARFRVARRVRSGEIATHRDRSIPFEIWVVKGFRGYGDGN